MSFTSRTKDELSKLEFTNMENISELSAIIQSNAVITDKITLITENSSVARRIYTLIKKIFNINSKITIRKGYNYSKKLHYILEINQNVNRVLKTLGIKKEKPDTFIYADDDLVRAYLKGVFIMCGSINDPKTSRYHLEFNLTNNKYAEFISNLLNKYDLNSKVLIRENRYMVYIKEAEKISDFLRLIGAYNAVLYYEDIRIYRDHKNMTNRLNNCEQANVEKTIETANNQLRDIKFLEEKDCFILLNEKEKEAATYRKKYPEASLVELSEIVSLETGVHISKSGLYHRFRKIKDLADKIRNKK